MNVSSLSALAEQVWYLVSRGGWVMLAIFILGQLGWFLVMERWWHYRNQAREALAMLDADQNIGSNPEALAVLEARIFSDSRLRGMFAEVALAIATVRTEGEQVMIRRARAIIHRGSHSLHKHLGTIAAIASAAPMLGLAGTVGGVMVTFRVITVYGIGNPAMMAGGIAEALMVTEAALVVALPLMILHDRLATRADQIESECVAGATRLIHAFSANSKNGEHGVIGLSAEHDDHMGNHGSAVKI